LTTSNSSSIERGYANNGEADRILAYFNQHQVKHEERGEPHPFAPLTKKVVVRASVFSAAISSMITEEHMQTVVEQQTSNPLPHVAAFANRQLTGA
jgi:hypothetical protein